MKQDYFDERLKDMLEEGEAHPFEKDQWRRLDRRLREADRPATPFWLRWLPVAFLLLLGASAWQYFTLSGQITALETSLLASKQVDESIQTRTTILYDTVYLKTTVEETVEGNYSGNSELRSNTPSKLGRQKLRSRHSFSSFEVQPFGPGFTDDPFWKTPYPSADGSGRGNQRALALARTDQLGQGFREYQQRQLFAETEDKFLEDGLAEKLDGITGLSEEPLAFLKVNALTLPTFSAPAASPYTYPKPSVFQRAKPKTYALSAGVGGMKETAFLQDDHGWHVGLGLYLGFSKRIGLHLGADYLSRSFRIGEDDIERFAFPIAETRNVDDELESISGSPNLLQLPLGLRVKLFTSGGFSAFTEGGIIATKAFPTELMYTFEENGSDEVYYDVSLENGLNHSLAVNAWYGRLGVQYNWPKRWGLQLTASRQQGFGDFAYAYGQPDFLRFRLSGVRRW